jgi:hypothetical protein
MVLLLGLLFFLASWVFVGQHAVGANVGIANFDNREGEDLRLVDALGEGRVAG